MILASILSGALAGPLSLMRTQAGDRKARRPVFSLSSGLLCANCPATHRRFFPVASV